MTTKKWTGVIGLMSGTSLDGLDCCYVEFSQKNDKYQYRNMVAMTFRYAAEWKQKLQDAFYLSEADLENLDTDYGIYLSQKVNEFIRLNNLNGQVDLIASHGHTVFHQPQKGITVQIGSGKILCENTGIKTITNFRIKDVELGGQGAPLVPAGDHFLFSKYEACLNLGGFSNISFILDKERRAFDICPVNLPLNIYCQKYFDCEFDRDGAFAESGQLIPDLYKALNELPYYSMLPPKSLGFEWLNSVFIPIIDRFAEFPKHAVMRTITDHAGHQISSVLNKHNFQNVLVTGGGAYNKHLINFLKKGETKIVIPSAEIVEFKEALVFAFLGYLNLNNSINTFKSVTGAKEDSTGGVRYFGHQH